MSARWTYSTIRLLFTLAVLFQAVTVRAQTAPHVRENLWVTDGVVHTTIFSGNTVYLGGSFTQVGPPVGNGAAIDLSSGLALTPYPRVDGAVLCVAPDGAGGWFLGGGFRHVDGLPRQNLARIDAFGNVTPWNPQLVGQTFSLLVANGSVYVTGFFNEIDGAPRAGAAAFDLATGMLTNWDPSPNGSVYQLAAAGGRIYLGGQFSDVGGQPRNLVAAVDPVSGACLPWTSAHMGSLLTVWAGTVYLSSTTTGDVTAVSELTGDVVFSVPGSGGVIAAVPDPSSGTIYLGGGFTSISGTARNQLAAIDEDGVLTAWNPGANGEVTDIALDSGVVIVGGQFTTVGGQSRPYLASLGIASGAVTSWNPRPNGFVLTVEASNGIAYAGGYFTSMNTVPRLNAAAIDASSGSALPWNPGPNGQVDCMAAGSGLVYLGGAFNQVGGLTRIHFAAVNATTGTPTAWTANMTSGDSNKPLAMTLFGNTLYTGGSFQIISGVLRRFLAALDATTGAVLPWDPNPNSVVTTIQAQPGTDVTNPARLYVGGWFTSVGGIARNYLAAIDLSTGIPSSWNPNPNNIVYRLSIVRDFSGFPQAFYFGGSFTAVQGIPRGRGAAVNVSGDLFPWDPKANRAINALVPSGGRVYVGGSFTTLSGQPTLYFGAVDNVSGNPTAWMPQVLSDGSGSSVVNTVLKFRSTLYVGGYFFSAQGYSSSYFAGLIDTEVTAVEQEPSPPAPSLLHAAPNPFRVSTVARFALPHSGFADVSVYDVGGRRVRQLHLGLLAAGEHALPWEGSNDRGQRTPAGIYFLRISTPSVDQSVKLLRLR